MGDWKGGLGQAAEILKLGSKAKSRIGTPVPMPIVNSPIVKNTTERPVAPPMPGYPTKPAAQDAPHSEFGTAGNLGVGNSSQLDAHASSSASVAKKPVAPPIKKPAAHLRTRRRALPPPFRNPHTSFTNSTLPPDISVRVASPSQGVPRAQFSAPDMARYTIRYGEADGCVDQIWQEMGTSPTLRPRENRGRTQCTLGLDFGTAFTKACVQFRHATFIVHWDRAVPSCTPFLLPGVFTVLSGGTCVLGVVAGGRVQGELKMALLTAASRDGQVNATAFLALVTRYVRSWLFSQHANVFSGFDLEWFVNVGLPAVPWDNLGLRRRYESIACAGWQLGTAAGPITIEAAASVLSRVQAGSAARPGGLQRERFAAFPEFVAQINSYRKSFQSRRDLHLLVDVGAGTVDIVTFHVCSSASLATEPEETDRYSILAASVENRGTHVLLGNRAHAGELQQCRWDEAAAGLTMREFESKFGLSQGKLKPTQEHFVDQFYVSLEKVLRQTKVQRYQTSPAWKEGVPFFLCGGGRNVDVYREAVRAIQTGWRVVEMRLPWPDGLVPGKLARRDFHRISVAHGLSYSADNIGEIERKSEVPDLHRVPMASVDYGSRYLDK